MKIFFLSSEDKNNQLSIHHPNHPLSSSSSLFGPGVIRPFNFQFQIKNWKSMSIFDFPFFFFLYKG